MARLPLCGVAAGSLMILGLACSSGSRTPLVGEPGNLAGSHPTDSSAATTPDSLALVYDLALDPTTLEATLAPQPARSGMAQGFVFDLDIANFMRPANLRVQGVERLLSGDLQLTLRHSHPFPAPNRDAPAVGLNRADLGFTGRLVVLADDLNTPYFSGAVRIDPGLVGSPDGFVEVGNLLATSGLTNNAFPYMLLVDEARDNRVGDSNGGAITGSYVGASGGWQYANLGAGGTDWTGYDYLHGGQAADIDVVLQADRLAGPLSVQLAVLIKYTDPKGVGTGSKRLPRPVVDPTFFAYRLPHAALDVSRISGLTPTLIDEAAGATADIQFAIRDWDAQANAAADTDLSDESDVTLVLPSTTGFPTVEIDLPELSPAPQTILPAGGATGLPGDEIPFFSTVTNTFGTKVPGLSYGLIRATDKEDGIPAATNIHFGVDPTSLVADPARALRVRTYQTVPMLVEGVGAIPQVLSVDPAGGALGRVGDLINFSAIASNAPTGWNWDFDGGTVPPTSGVAAPAVNLGARGTYLGRVNASNANGTSADFLFSYSVEPFGWVRTWGSTGSDAVTALATDASGNAIVGGVFSGTVDFDPGPGSTLRTATGPTDAFVAKYSPDGNLLWAVSYGGNADLLVTSLVVDSLERIHVIGTASATFDADPGAATSSVFLSAPGYYTTLLDSAGNYVRSAGWDGAGVTGSVSVTGALGPADSLLVGGQFINSVGFDLDPGFGIVNVTSAPSYPRAFLVSLDSSGTYQWGVHYGNPLGATRLRDLLVDATGTLRLVGNWSETTDFDPGGGTTNRTAVAPFDDAYLASFTSAGTFLNVQTWGSNNEDQAQAIALQTGNTLTVGSWTRGASPVDVDPGAGVVNVSMADTTLGGVYLSRFDVSTPVPVYVSPAVRGWNSIGTLRFESNPTDGSIVASMRLATSLDADPGPGTIPLTGVDDSVFITTDPNGDYLAHYLLNEAGSPLQFAVFEPGNGIYAAGYFAGGPFDFDPSPFVEEATSAGSNDAFLMRFNPQLTWD